MTSPNDEVDEELLAARAYLLHVAEPPAPGLHEFVADHGPLRAAELVRRGRTPRRVSDEVESRRAHRDGAGDLELGRERGLGLLVPEHAAWPGEEFASFANAAAAGAAVAVEPLALWVRRPEPSCARPLRSLAERAVALVGARAASGYGEQVAADFGAQLANHGCTIVSGAAYGVDGTAHRGALSVGGATIAVLACGADLDYPAGHARLLSSVAAQGLVISEYPPGTPPRRHRFLVRNRLIAALGAGTVVVEAGARSGASNTAGVADALGRDVMAVPGPVTSGTSVGCHAMVRSGMALLVTRPEEVVEVVGPLGCAQVDGPASPVRETDQLDREAMRVYESLDQRSGVSTEAVARESGLPVRRVRAVLPELEVAGFIAREEMGWKRLGA